MSNPNSSIHEFDVSLGPGTAVTTPATAARHTAREVHVNAWRAGTKGLSTAQIGDATLTPTTGLTVATNRTNSPALVNLPTELVIGDTAAAPGIINTTELDGNSGAVTVVTLSGFYIP